MVEDGRSPVPKNRNDGLGSKACAEWTLVVHKTSSGSWRHWWTFSYATDFCNPFLTYKMEDSDFLSIDSCEMGSGGTRAYLLQLNQKIELSTGKW